MLFKVTSTALINPHKNLKCENSQDYAQKPPQDCTFMNSASVLVNSTGIFKQSMGARNRVGLWFSYRHARLHSLRNWFLGIDSWAPSNFKNSGLFIQQATTVATTGVKGQSLDPYRRLAQFKWSLERGGGGGTEHEFNFYGSRKKRGFTDNSGVGCSAMSYCQGQLLEYSFVQFYTIIAKESKY